MNNLIHFNFKGNTLNAMLVNNEPYFIAKDVASILGYVKTENAIARHCKASVTTPKQGGGYMTIIPERDVYRLVICSKLPEAEQFEEWVVAEVLPSIRKTGGYSIVNTLPDFNNPAEAARAWADQYDTNIKLIAANQEQTTKIESLESLFVQGETICEFCKKLNGVNANAVNRTFELKGWLYNESKSTTRWRVKSYARDRYLTEETGKTVINGLDCITHKPVLLKKGAVKIYEMYLKDELPMKKDWNGSYTQDKHLGVA